MAKWDFLMTQSRNGKAATWRWRKTGWDLTVSRSKRAFSSYEECVADAMSQGYNSSLPTVITRPHVR